jgi:hypothetical protein
VEACAAGRLAADPKVVISNNADAEALARARRLGIPCCHLSGTTIPTPPASTPRSATRWPPMTREGVDTATVQALYADWQQAAFAQLGVVPSRPPCSMTCTRSTRASSARPSRGAAAHLARHRGSAAVIEEAAAADGLSEPRFPAAGWSTRPVGRAGPRRSSRHSTFLRSYRLSDDEAVSWVSIAMPQCNRYIALRSPFAGRRGVLGAEPGAWRVACARQARRCAQACFH